MQNLWFFLVFWSITWFEMIFIVSFFFFKHLCWKEWTVRENGNVCKKQQKNLNFYETPSLSQEDDHNQLSKYLSMLISLFMILVLLSVYSCGFNFFFSFSIQMQSFICSLSLWHGRFVKKSPLIFMLIYTYM